MFLKNTAGTYEPAFFIIRIDADQAPEDLLAENESTFIHEYVHLLQDLVLPYCMRENIARLETFLLQIQNARQQGELRLPSSYSDANVELVKRINEFTWGSSSSHDGVTEITRVELVEDSVEGQDYKLQKYLLSAVGVHGYHFGARDLLEYIASKLESRHFPDAAKPMDLPYRSVDLVLAHEGLGYLSDVKRVALVEYCLLNDNPARRLMVMIEDIRKGYFAGADDGDDDAFVARLQNLQWVPNGAPARSITQKLAVRYEQLKETLRDQFPPDTFPTIYAWLNGVLQYAQEALAGRSMFTSLYQMETAQFRKEIGALLARLGVPLVVNRHGSLGSSLGDETSKHQFIQLLLAYEFTDYLQRDEPTCPLYARCEADSPELIDATDCMDAPFRRAQRDELCPFGVFVKATGLAQVRWYTKDRLIPGWRTDSSLGHDWP